MFIEIRFHGRGGQGAVTAANLLVASALIEGIYGQAFPFFGAERRGAPVLAFARISDKPIRIHSEIKEPDVVVVFDPSLIEIVVNQINNLNVTISELQEKLIQMVKEYDSELLHNITSIVGIGENTAALLILYSEGFNSFDNAKQLCSYFGLAPTEYRSGTSINGSKKISKMGNPLVRKKLFMCSLQASRYNKSCMDLYLRLLAKGKPKKVALIAVVNKLLKIVFAIAKSGLPYDKEYKSYIVSR